MSLCEFFPMKKRRLCKTPNGPTRRSASTLGMYVQSVCYFVCVKMSWLVGCDHVILGFVYHRSIGRSCRASIRVETYITYFRLYSFI